ncbi:putative membrane protein [Hartmannibacter diazotrophicus]|uniref:Putative membrane protein n=1 Tax=Hartmannibacter diazotrophicus TaxID=1482074 RepID=A0A2C9DCT7_9HYPH|nr:putative membrane protein [Hartmannibacter diazotrophicus]
MRNSLRIPGFAPDLREFKTLVGIKSIADSRPQFKLGLLLAALTAALFGALVYLAVYSRGPWMDEFWSLYLSSPELSTSDAFWTRWALDVHPPLFSMLLHLSQSALDLSIVTGRMLNTTPAALTALFFLTLALVDKSQRKFLLVYSILVLSCWAFIRYFPEFRSYFSALCSFAILIACLKRIDATEEPLSGINGTLVWAGFAASLAFCINLHYIVAFITVVTVAVFGIGFALRRHWKLFWTLAVLGTLSVAPLLAFFIAQRQFLEHMAETFWLNVGTLEALVLLSKFFLVIASGSAIATLVALVRLPSIFMTGVRQSIADDPEVRFALMLIVAMVIAIAAVLVVNVERPIVQARYMLSLGLLQLALVATLSSSLILQSRLLLGLVFLNSAVSILYQGHEVGSEKQWYSSAEIIKHQLALCPASRVHPERGEIFGDANYANVKELAYHYTARHAGFPIDDLDTPITASPAAQCPPIVWAEHYFDLEDRTDEDLREKILPSVGVNGTCARSKVYRAESGVVIVLDPSEPGCMAPAG